MIEIRCNLDMTEITAQGHSNYDVEGKDVVCASVSASFVLASNLLRTLNIKHDFASDPHVPFIGIKIAKGKMIQGKAVVMALVETMKLLHDQYPTFVKVSKVSC